MTMILQDKLWTEKYRPKTISDYVFVNIGSRFNPCHVHYKRVFFDATNANLARQLESRIFVDSPDKETVQRFKSRIDDVRTCDNEQVWVSALVESLQGG